jgi:dinuclear metal center YbgI/SA1388 family protein
MASLDQVETALQEIAPLHLAEPWDNVGLLLGSVEPRPITQLLCTVDLTEAVLDEALALGAEMIVAYHPPWFEKLRRLGARAPQERVLLRAARHGVVLYSPHTALDAAPRGLGDWLAGALGEAALTPLVPAHASPRSERAKLVTFVPEAALDGVRSALAAAGAGRIGGYSECSFAVGGTGSFFGGEGTAPRVGEAQRLERVAELRLEMVCDLGDLPALAYEEPAWEVVPLADKPIPGAGAGRRAELAAPTTLDLLVERVKARLGVPTLRVAASERHARGEPIAVAAVCPGAGGSLFERVSGVDLLLTGELRHHDVLARVTSGTSVLLAEHTTTERGFLSEFARRLAELLPDTRCVLSERDRSPLEYR